MIAPDSVSLGIRTQQLFEIFAAIANDDINNADDTKRVDSNDAGRFENLMTWLGDNADTICDDLVMVESVRDSHRGKRLLNMGSPLYCAVVSDIPEAVKILLMHGADPNYIHPSHGDSALLHCASRGYDSCLLALLQSSVSDRIDPSLHVTTYRRFMLGQGLPQYEEGGLNPLSVAVRNGRVDIMRILISACPPMWTRLWMEQKDTIGRTVVENVFDRIALTDSNNNQKLGSMNDICNILVGYIKQQHECGDAGGFSVVSPQPPTREEALNRSKERLRLVRGRCLIAESARKERNRIKGLQAVKDSYVPRHPDVYVKDQVKEACFCDLKCSPSSSENVAKAIRGGFTFGLINPSFCGMIWDEIHNYERVASSDPSLRLPLRVRHDGNIGDLQDCGFAPLLDALADLCEPVLQRCMSDSSSGHHNQGQVAIRDDLEVYHAFLTRNYDGREGNSTFKIHQDKSLFTINLCLHASDDFEGSSVGFFEAPWQKETLHDHQTSGARITTPGIHDRIYTYTHEVGHAVIHSGNVFHQTDPILKGTRGSLILWLRPRHEAHRILDNLE